MQNFKKNYIFFYIFLLLNNNCQNKKLFIYVPLTDANAMRYMYHTVNKKEFIENRFIVTPGISLREQFLTHYFLKHPKYNSFNVKAKNDFLSFSSNVFYEDLDWYLYFSIPFESSQYKYFLSYEDLIDNKNDSLALSTPCVQIGYDWIKKDKFEFGLYNRFIFPVTSQKSPTDFYHKLVQSINNNAMARFEYDFGLNSHYYIFNKDNNYFRITTDFYFGYVGKGKNLYINNSWTRNNKIVYEIPLVYAPYRSELVLDFVYGFNNHNFNLGYNLKGQIYELNEDSYNNLKINESFLNLKYLNIIFFGYKYFFDYKNLYNPTVGFCGCFGSGSEGKNVNFFDLEFYLTFLY